MKPRKLFLIILLLLICGAVNGQDYKFLRDTEGLKGITAVNGIENAVTIRVIYDNYVHSKEFKPDWGYAILIEGLHKNILFDTGAKPDVFESNFKSMGLDAMKIDFLVLSHEHGDHTAGILALTNMRTGIPVIIPYSFSGSFKRKMTESGYEPLQVKEPVKICTNLYSSGEFSGSIPEQALVLNTKKGLVVMTGCSHPGVVEMLKEIKAEFNKDIYMVFGGFHLLNKSDEEMNRIIEGMKALGVVKCGATHCTGEKQTRMIREAFKADFVELGAGNSIKIL
jgi:7,8-dihydropterin-6-yl-methyl-4-(beta-D-ribofuranosyl)aminobenzene 5'-phosphate synthase